MEFPAGKHAWMVKIGEKGQFVVPKEARAIGMTYNQLCEEIVQQSYRLKRRG